MFKNKILYTCLFISGIAASALIAGCSNANKNIAKSHTIDSIYNAGQLKPTDSVIKHTFYIKNTGTADLVIDSVGGSCSCTNITWEKKPIKPGENGFVNVTVRSDTSEVKGTKIREILAKTNATTPFTVLRVTFIR